MKTSSLLNRPWIAFFLTLIWLILAAFYTTRVIAAIITWQLLSQITYPFASYYLVISGTIWGLAWFYICFGVWFGKNMAWKNVHAITIIYFIWIWLERIVLSWLNGWNTNDIPFFVLSFLFLSTILWMMKHLKISHSFEKAQHGNE
jgi:hypothetical protein